MGHWIDVRLQQPAPNVDAIGAWLDVRVGDRTTAREVTVGGGHASGELGWLHTGHRLGRAGGGARAVARRHGRAVDDRCGAGQRVTIVRGETGAAHLDADGVKPW